MLTTEQQTAIRSACNIICAQKLYEKIHALMDHRRTVGRNTAEGRRLLAEAQRLHKMADALRT